MEEQKKQEQSTQEEQEQFSKSQPENNGKGENKNVPNKESSENKLWAFLSYLNVLCLVALLFKKDSEFVQFHAKQGLVLFIGEFFIWIPFFGWILGVIIFILWIMGIRNVLAGEKKSLPVVGEIAEKIHL